MGINILIADDDNVFRELVEDILRKNGYHVFSACDGEEAIEKFYKYHSQLDLVILDVKFFDEENYEKYTKGNFENFVAVGKYCSDKGIRLWLRTVVVPGINDTEESIKKYARFSKQFQFEKYELLAFHTMGFFKYENLKIENPLSDTPALDKDKLKKLQDYLNECIKKR